VITIKGMIEQIVSRFPIKRIIAVADRGLLSTENLTDLLEIVLPRHIGFMPMRRFCFMAQILYGVMRSLLKDSYGKISPERTLDKLRHLQHWVVKANDLEPVAALTNINQEHTAIFLQALTIKKPIHPSQLTLL